MVMTCGADCRDWLKVALAAVAIASVAIAYLSLRVSRRKLDDDRLKDQDKEYVAQVERSFEWAFEALTDGDTSKPPRADRLNWLASARYLLRAQDIASQIKTPVYRAILDQIEDHWRQRFYRALDHLVLATDAYFAATDATKWPENIEISSALVVVDFSNWKAGTADPTDRVDRSALMESGAGIQGKAGIGLKRYIQRVYAAGAQHRSDEDGG